MKHSRILKTFFLILMMSIACLAVTAISCHAATFSQGGKSVIFHKQSPWYIKNDQWIEGDYPAFVDEQGVYYVSITTFQAAFDCQASYNPADRSVFVQFRDKNLWQGIGYPNLFIGDQSYTVPAPFVDGYGVCMVPAEVYASTIGYQVTYDQPTDYANNGRMCLRTAATTYRITRLEVNKRMQMVTIFGTDPAGNTVPVRYCICSSAANGTSTPNGTFRLNALTYNGSAEWYYFRKFNCWVMYATQISGNVCFHSVSFSSPSFGTLGSLGYSQLGQAASHGCIRLFAEDAQFIWNYCDNVPVTISNGYYSDELQRIKNQIIASKLPYSAYVQYLKNNF